MSSNKILFGTTVFVGSFLLFLIEPIAAKQLLPVLGGSAAVWITCLVFFQTVLLLGYLYAHWVTRASKRDSNGNFRFSKKWASVLHLFLLLVALLSSLLWSTRHIDVSQQTGHPIVTIFRTLTSSLGLPFLMLASTSPLLQVWLARLSTKGVPYRLFALSNTASLMALALYPTIVEPYFTLRVQRIVWSFGFLIFVLLSALVVLRMRSEGSEHATLISDEAPEEELRSFSVKLLWLLLPLGAAMQLSAVTSHLTENIAAIPLLWILPLAIYLLTFILAFQSSRFIPRTIVIRFLAVLLASLGYMLSKIDVSVPIFVSIPFYLIEVFVACLFLHTEVYALRPPRASESTVFYLMIAAGGALGSLSVGIVAPLLFSSNYDLAISFLATALLALAVTWQSGWAQRFLWFSASILLFVLIFLLHAAYEHHTLINTRNFYGSLRVTQTDSANDYILRTLTNGTIQHGTQLFSAPLMRIPTTYYAEDSGIGLALRFCCQNRPRKIGVIGLGVGTVAAYGRAGDSIRFYEINPAVQPIAQHLFTYLRDSPAHISFAAGDARTSLAHEGPNAFDVLIIDAFSGDAIPLHLLTADALKVYLSQLAPSGILAFHVSNQHVDLEPELTLLAKSANLQTNTIPTASNDARGEFSSTWVLLTRNRDFLDLPDVASRTTPTKQRANLRLWTDDYSSLLPLLRW